MASEKEIEQRKRILRARGVPEAFVDNIAKRKDNGAHQFLLIAVGLVTAFALPALFLFDRPVIDDVLAPLLYGNPVSTWMFGVQISYFVFLGCLWWYITISLGVIFELALGGPVKPFPAYSSIAVGLRSLSEDDGPLETMKPYPGYQALAHLGSDQAFLEAVNKPKGRRWHVFWLTVLLGVGLICHFDYWTLQGNEITLHRPWGTRTYDLRHAKYAAVDCRDGEDDNQLEYDIYFPHKHFELAMRRDVVNRLSEPNVFARIERVDAFLVQAGVPVYREERTAKSAHDDGPCHAIWADPMGRDGTARFDRLLYKPSPATPASH